MFVTFGILTDNKTEQVKEIVQSILANNIPHDKYEVIIVGNINEQDLPAANTKVIYDPNLEVANWITRKKNLIIENSTASEEDFVIIAKDYIKYDSNWYKGLLQYGGHHDFDIVMNEIRNTQGKRYLDWIWNNPILGDGRNVNYKVENHEKMFVPGCLTMAKRKVFTRHVFKEKMIGLGKQTDIDWSNRAFKEFRYSFNEYSKCIAFGKGSNRYPRFRRLCQCKMCT